MDGFVFYFLFLFVATTGNHGDLEIISFCSGCYILSFGFSPSLLLEGNIVFFSSFNFDIYFL